MTSNLEGKKKNGQFILLLAKIFRISAKDENRVSGLDILLKPMNRKGVVFK